jgi:hypothetical protein
MEDKNAEQTAPGLLQITLSVLAGFCGIQTTKNHDRDEAHIEKVGFKPYIVIGIAMTIAFVLCLYAIAQLIVMQVNG